MTKYITLFCALLFSNATCAQQAYSAPDQELWNVLAKGIDDLPMSANVHLQAQQIMANVEREAQAREMRAKALADAAKAKSEAEPR